MKHFRVLPLILLPPLLFACQSYSSAADLQQAERQIAGGNSAAARDLVEHMQEVPAGLRAQAIESLAQAPGAVGDHSLAEVAQQNRLSDEHRSLALQRLSERESEGARAESRRILEREPRLINEPMVRAFGAARDRESVPLLRRAAEERPALVAPVIAALAQIGDDASHEFILAQVLNEDPANRKLAIEALSAVENPGLQTQAATLYEGMVRNPQGQTPEILRLAVAELGRHGQVDSAYPPLRALYYNPPDAETKQAALVAMARLRGISVEQMLASLNPQPATRPDSLRDGPASIEFLRERQQTLIPSNPRPQSEPRHRNSSANRRRNFPDDYRRRLLQAMEYSLGDNAAGVAQQIHNALLAYRDSREPKSEFVVRAYRKHFEGDDQQQRERLAQGLNFPGSLTVIVWNVIDEYATDPLRAYALAEMFAIKRWQAAILLDLVRRSRI
ncbi:MAG: hypothetical protein K1X75_12850 [Leptospirales bacterium]|nr:hypothetical protein [Leptospirales bacterium]